MKARAFGQPAADELGFVGAVVIQQGDARQVGGHVLLDVGSRVFWARLRRDSLWKAEFEADGQVNCC